ncbi:MAG: DUF5696 domain-containing protein [Clostridia bacterium]|nr:DUF5696 domain-containing protein [Clostridia bacterium]
MKKSIIKIISVILTSIMVVTSIGITSVSAAATANYDYANVEMASESAKLATMTLYKEAYGYQIYADEYSGEVAFVKVSTGQVLFTNPYDAGGTSAASSATVRQQLLSQIIITYEDDEGTESTMYSYTEASLRSQITIKNIKGGIRVEYAMGRQDTRRLVPRMIEKTRFETLILANIDSEFYYNKLLSMYVLQDPYDTSLSERAIAEMQAKYPITNSMAVYIYATNASDYELATSETTIKTYCPDYSYEDLDYDHELTGYEGTDEAPALFRLALEYTLSEDGIEARLPANGIRYDETTYTLIDITVLPYMGAISSENEGYSFLPDGSGSLINADDLAGITWNRAGQMYGPDYAYSEISGAHQEVMTVPVWGAVTTVTESVTTTETEIITEAYTYTDEETGEEVEVPAETKTTTTTEEVTRSKGYVAIITEGDSMAELMYANGGSINKYASMQVSFTPQPSDEYNLSESISAASNTTWRVTSSRKYTDSYRILYIMLDDEELAADAIAAGTMSSTYEPTYYGMASAYRDYLEKQGILTRITEEETADNMPLYIEVLGTLQTTEKILSIPVTVDTALTTFEDIITMYEELSAEGVDNINFKLTGFANGGLSDSYVPYNLNWEDAVGGSEGFEALLEYASDKNLGIYPDFDFAYAANDKLLDGFSYSSHAVKTIDDRYTSKRYYDATTQSYTRNYEIAISPSVYYHFWEKFSVNYAKYDAVGISVSTLGTDLNSDFDEDDPYNREDSKQYTMELLEDISANYDVMVDGGNAYTFAYVKHIVNVTLNSSQFYYASYEIPFIGLVLHGYINIAGNPINEEGDVESAFLKAIESGASLNFILAYQNTSALKEDEQLNSYYSVRYDIWKEDIVEMYTELNSLIGDLQTSLITGHELLLDAQRVPTDDEAAQDASDIAAAEAAAAEEEAAAAAKEAAAAALALRKLIEAAPDTAAEYVENLEGYVTAIEEAMASITETAAGLDAALASVDDAEDALEEMEALLAAAKVAAGIEDTSSDDDGDGTEDDGTESDDTDSTDSTESGDTTTEDEADVSADGEDADEAETEDTDADATDSTESDDTESDDTESDDTDSGDSEDTDSDESEEEVDISTLTEEELVEYYEGKVEEAEAAYDSAVSAYNALITSINKQYENAAAALESAKADVESAQALEASVEAYIADPSDYPVTLISDEDAAATYALVAEAENVLTSVENAMSQMETLYASVDTTMIGEEAESNGTETDDTDSDDTESGDTDSNESEETEDPSEEEEETVLVDTTSKYIVDDGSVVLVTYENGRSFILNYNNFQIKVTVNGTEYTIGAYDYEVIWES